MSSPRTISAVPLLLAAVLATGACGSGQGTATGAARTGAAAAAPSPSGSPAAPVTVTDPWVKATGSGMSAAFGTLVNTTGASVTVVSVTTPFSSMVELHEVVDDGGTTKMQPKQGGITIPAKGTHQLQPGGDHIMLMKVNKPIEPGAEIPFTLTLKDGGTVGFTAVAKDFAGARESYAPSPSAHH